MCAARYSGVMIVGRTNEETQGQSPHRCVRVSMTGRGPRNVRITNGLLSVRPFALAPLMTACRRFELHVKIIDGFLGFCYPFLHLFRNTPSSSFKRVAPLGVWCSVKYSA